MAILILWIYQFPLINVSYFWNEYAKKKRRGKRKRTSVHRCISVLPNYNSFFRIPLRNVIF